MDRNKLKRLIFMALCCDLGIFAKKLILPAANILTDSLHIPGGVGTSFSLMFIVVAAAFVPRFGSGTLMGLVQSGIALCMGTVGSMGALAPIGYILPGFAIDFVLFVSRKLNFARNESLVIANSIAAVSACIAANIIVFNLRGIVLLLYVSVSLTSGAICGLIAGNIVEKLEPIFGKDVKMKNKKLFIIIAVLIALTAIIAVIHLTTRTPDAEGEILVNGESVKISDLKMSPVTGTVVNGKGEEKQIDAQGVILSEACGGEFSTATVTASDEYSAVVKSGEDAYLILSDDGSLRLIVFGDENSKRDVKDVVRIDFE